MRALCESKMPGAKLLSLALSLGLWLTACTSQQRPKTEQAQHESTVKRYELKGKVVSVDKYEERVTVDHQSIPGFMGAMTMPYPVKDARLLDQLSPGDEIAAQVVQRNGEFWLENIVVVHREQRGSTSPGS